MSKLLDWLESGEYLPKFFRDFHEQKDIFKTMHILYDSVENPNRRQNMPSWVDGHCYVIDWFLWFMASRGYTLQKSRKKIEFNKMETFREWDDNGYTKNSLTVDTKSSK